MAHLRESAFAAPPRGIQNARVEFKSRDRLLAAVTTDEQGRAVAVWEWSEPEPSDEAAIAAAAEVGPLRLQAERNVHLWNDDRTVIAVDIDETVCHPNYLVVSWGGTDWASPPVADSCDVLWELSKSFHILYVSARPGFLVQTTRQWLKDHNFPPGPLVTGEAVTDVFRQGAAKREALREMRKLYPNILIGIGDKAADIDAFGNNGMFTIIVNSSRGLTGDANRVIFDSWRDVLEFFRRHGDALRDASALTESLAEGSAISEPERRPTVATGSEMFAASGTR